MTDCSNTEEYFAEKQRMTKRTSGGTCKINCSDCPLSYKNNGVPGYVSCVNFEMCYPQQAISIMQRWSNEHPQRTYLTEFLEHYPNAELDENGIPKICRWKLGLAAIKERNCVEGDCIKCWNQPVSVEDGEE